MSGPTEPGKVEAMDFWLPVIIVFTGNFLLFFYCHIKKDNSFIDVMWGFSFVTPVIGLFIKKFLSDGPNPDTRSWIVLVLVAIWASRLSLHIGWRHVKEDFRYAEMRRDWTEKGGYWGYVLRAFFIIFMMQAAFSLVTNSCALYVHIYSNSENLIWLDFVGIAVWLFGFLFEWIGDEQLKRHLADKSPDKPKFIKWGLWRYTRHPNYFGECVLWWGIYFLACSVKFGFATIYAPVFINLLIRFLSGVPMLEEKYLNNPEFKQYMRETNVFFPWFVTKTAEGKNSDEEVL